MDFSIAKSKIERISQRLNLIIFVCVILLISNLALVLLCWHTVSHQSKIIVPANFSKPFKISDSNVDSSYLQEMALFFVNARLNVTPKTIAGSQKLLLEYTSPKFYHTFKQILTTEKHQIIKNKISGAFFVQEAHSYPKSLKVVVRGKMKRWVGERGLPPSIKNYLIQFSYKNARLSIESFSQITANKTGDKHA